MKILIISHTPVSTDEAMGKTFLSLFEGFKKQELCQFFIHPSMPNIDYCNSYFRITDKDILNSYFKLFSVNSKKIVSSDIDTRKTSLFENPSDVAVYKNPKNKTSLRVLMRDLMWKLSKWYTKELEEWIKTENPTHIFFAPGGAKFIYDIAIKISKKFNLPIVTYICDEYYFVKKQSKILDKIRVNLLQRKMRKLISCCSHIVTICDALSKLYSNEFSVPATTIMTGASFEIQNNTTKTEKISSLYFMGNIRCNRYVSLLEIGKTLKDINEENSTDFSLKIYTDVNDVHIISQLKSVDTIKLCGHIVGEKFDLVFHNADILLHTEAFDERSIDLVKNSVSTKIADSLASGIPLFAYGPPEVASMQHLIDNNCAVTATTLDGLYDALKSVFFDCELREKVVANALKTAKKYHNSNINSQRLYDMFNCI